MRTFKATILQDASDLPWECWDDTDHTRTRDEVWGVTLVPTPIYASRNENGQGVGEILYYEWSALLDPSDTPLPEWITETTPVETTNP
jgi:hypothetical protein